MPYIIQLSDTPVTEEGRLTEYEVQDSVLYDHVVSYVYPDTDIEVAQAEFLSGLEGDDCRCAPYITEDRDEAGNLLSIRFSPEHRDMYFGKKHARYNVLLGHLTERSDYKSFVGYETKAKLHEIFRLVEDVYDDYVYMDEEYTPMDTFLRHAQADTPYYIGSIFVYKI